MRLQCATFLGDVYLAVAGNLDGLIPEDSCLPFPRNPVHVAKFFIAGKPAYENLYLDIRPYSCRGAAARLTFGLSPRDKFPRLSPSMCRSPPSPKDRHIYFETVPSYIISPRR